MSVFNQRVLGAQICSFDRNGRVVALAGPDGGVTRFVYDGDRRVIGVQDPDGRRYEVTWEAGGAYVAMRGVEPDDESGGAPPAGIVRTCAFDAAGRLVEFTGPNGGITRLEYDRARNVLRIHEPSPVHEVRWESGRASDVVFDTKTGPAYPLLWDVRDVVCNFTYDRGDRQELVPTQSVTYTYDRDPIPNPYYDDRAD